MGVKSASSNSEGIVIEILDLVLKNPSILRSNTLDGKLLTALNLIYYSRILDRPCLYDLGFDVLEYSVNKELFSDTNDFSVNFLDGIIGVFATVLELTQKKMISFDVSEILEITNEKLLSFATTDLRKFNFFESLNLELYLDIVNQLPSHGIEHLKQNANKIVRSYCCNTLRLNSQERTNVEISESWNQEFKPLPASHVDTIKMYFFSRRSAANSIPKSHNIKSLIDSLIDLDELSSNIYLLAYDKEMTSGKAGLEVQIEKLYKILRNDSTGMAIEEKFVKLNQLLLLNISIGGPLIQYYWRFLMLSYLKPCAAYN